MKKFVYVFLWGVLGVLLQHLIHVLFETWIIFLLTKDFDRFGLGLSWDQWFAIHHIASWILFGVGVICGLWAGFHFWRVVYIEHRHWKRKPA